MSRINDNIKHIYTKIEEAAIKVGREPEEVTLIAVSKTYSAELINQAIDLGIKDIGENKVQEILDKYDKVKPVKWHMIGHLQTNKVKYIIDKVSMIHSVDSTKLANEIDKRAIQNNVTMDVLIQINPAMEESKFGISLKDVKVLYSEIDSQCKNIRICGLMCVVPFDDNKENTRKYYRQVKEIFDIIRLENENNKNFKYLSMGMSNDFNVAIEEGSNMVRIGTSIFGERNYT